MSSSAASGSNARFNITSQTFVSSGNYVELGVSQVIDPEKFASITIE